MTKNNNNILVYIGTYTTGESEGIYIYRMNPSSGILEFTGKATGVDNPSFLSIDTQKQYLYAVNEVGDFAGKPSGAVSAFAIDQKTGELTYLNKQPSHGASPCHLSVDKTDKFVLVANYGGGSVSVFPIEDDGKLGEATDVVQHHGSSVNLKRQKVPHAHSVTIGSSNRYAFVADLGLDKIMIYQLELIRGKLKPNDKPWVKVKAGAGPRHFAFHPNDKYAYVINELDSTLTRFTYDRASGVLSEIENVSTLPEDFEGTNYCADVHVLPSGKFVYGSNRGHDSIVIFKIDQTTGKLDYVDHESTQGKNPRNFAISPNGNFLFVANQDTNNIVAFRIDQETGVLTPTGQVTEVATPVCIKMV